MSQNVASVSVVIPSHNRKEKLIRLIDSVLNSKYPRDRLEVTVVDDASTDGTFDEVSNRFNEVRIIRNAEELFLSASRDMGIENSTGDYVFLLDDDNVVDKDCIKELVETLASDHSIGICGPIAYYLSQPSRVQGAGIERNMATSLTTWVGRNEIDHGQFRGLLESKDFPNAFMLRRELIQRTGSFQQSGFPIHYEEADFGERTRRAGYRIVCNPMAKVWHDVLPASGSESRARLYHVHSKVRAYYAGRNRIIFHKRYSTVPQFVIFIALFNWLVGVYYLAVILRSPFHERASSARAYIKGMMSGLSAA